MIKLLPSAFLALSVAPIISGMVFPRSPTPLGYLEEYTIDQVSYRTLGFRGQESAQLTDFCRNHMALEDLKHNNAADLVAANVEAPALVIATDFSTNFLESVQNKYHETSMTPSKPGDRGLITGGFATFFFQDGAAGACGKVHSDIDLIVALDSARYDNGKHCGKRVQIIRVDTGKSVIATVADDCPGCRNANSLDLSVGAFTRLAPESLGVFPIAWEFQ